MMEACGQPYEERVYGSAAKTLSQPAEMYRMFEDGVLAFDQVPLLEIDGLRLVQKFASSFCPVDFAYFSVCLVELSKPKRAMLSFETVNVCDYTVMHSRALLGS